MDPDLEREVIEGLELPPELASADPCVVSVLPESLCLKISPDLDWQWVAGPGTLECSTSSRGLSPASGAR